VASSSEEEIKQVVRHELKHLHGITAEPAFWKIFRWPRGIPQYTMGHSDRLARIDAGVARHPGLEVAGASYRGVGIPDCIASGRAAADRGVARAMEVRS
jgi:oxygen-dependent protoporphyrinogen oxidase